MEIEVLITGGTIDKLYDPIIGALKFKDSIIPQTLKHFPVKYIIKELMLVDSLNMTPQQRQEIVHYCCESSADKIIITHGTDTIIDTALEIQQRKLNKAIVLTGAMVPIRVEHSDGPMNLAYALGVISNLEHSTKIAIQGQTFCPRYCQKDQKKGLFVKKK
jgi:L-asparaginase